MGNNAKTNTKHGSDLPHYTELTVLAITAGQMLFFYLLDSFGLSQSEELIDLC